MPFELLIGVQDNTKLAEVFMCGFDTIIVRFGCRCRRVLIDQSLPLYKISLAISNISGRLQEREGL
jgi:hypothetical protein